MRLLGALMILGAASGFALHMPSTTRRQSITTARPLTQLSTIRGGQTVPTRQLAHLEGEEVQVNSNGGAAAVSSTTAVVPQARGGGAAAASGKGSLLQTLKVGSFFFLWYAFNIGYNIYNKKALNALPLPWLVGLAQLSLGLLYVFPLWLTGLRKAPKCTWTNVKNLSPVALMHALAHITAVIALGAGAVSFTHIVKAAEPAFTSLFSAVFLKQFFALPVYLSLVPVMGGVAIASMTERSFSWLAFSCAMAANTASAARGIFAKKTMKEPQGKNMDAVNLYAVLTILATVMMAPVALLVEGAKAPAVWDAALKVVSQVDLIKYIVYSGAFFYLYNEVAFLALDSVHPVTHAVGNTIKRVVVIAASILVFKNPVTTQGYIGSGIAVLGVLLYSLAVEKTKKR